MDETTPAAAPAAAPAAPAEAAPVQSIAGPAEGVNASAQDGQAPMEAIGEAMPPSYELHVPEGFEGFDEGALAGVKDFLAEHNVPPELAQPLFEKYAQGIRQALDGERSVNANAWSDLQSQWRAEVSADREIGGLKQDSVIAGIRKGAETLLGSKGAEELYSALDFTGAGNNPAVIRALNRAFAIHAPPSSVTGTPAGNAAPPKNASSIIYPDQGNARNR